MNLFKITPDFFEKNLLKGKGDFMEKSIKIKRRHLKGEVKGFLAAMFLIWLIVGGVILSKVLAPSINMLLLQDNSIYTQKYGNPDNWEAKDEAFASYNEYANTLVNSEDDIINWFFNLNKLVKVIVLVASIAPFVIITFYVYNVIDAFVAKQLIKRRKKIAVRV